MRKKKKKKMKRGLCTRRRSYVKLKILPLEYSIRKCVSCTPLSAVHLDVIRDFREIKHKSTFYSRVRLLSLFLSVFGKQYIERKAQKSSSPETTTMTTFLAHHKRGIQIAIYSGINLIILTKVDTVPLPRGRSHSF